MAKGIPLMGRDPDGKAKMINVDENGNVKVQLSGTMVEYNVTNAIRNAELTEERDWVTSGCTYTASNGVATLTSTSDESTMRLLEKTPLTTAKKGDKFYLKVTVTAKSDGLSGMFLRFRDWIEGGTYDKYFTLNPTKNHVNHISVIAEVDRDFVGEPQFYVTAATGSVAGLVLEITEPMMVNLTETFGAGNEPTIEEFESLMTESNGKVFFAKKHNLFNAIRIVESLRKKEQNQTPVSSGLLANRPLASAVPPGFAYYSWDAPEGQEMAYSDGTNWVVKS